MPRQADVLGMQIRRLFLVLLVAFSAVLCLSGTAFASGGNYVFQGGTPYQQLQVRDALNASTFNWSLVTQQITIDIDPSVVQDESTPGEIFLNPSLLNSGEFSWGVVQTEYANQVDFELLPQQDDTQFNTALGGTAWCYSDQAGLQLAQYGCERFAATLTWAYWQSPENCIQPSEVGADAAGMPPAAFRALLASVLGNVTSAPTATTPTASTTRTTYLASTYTPRKTAKNS
jgi:hypothetical protein